MNPIDLIGHALAWIEQNVFLLYGLAVSIAVACVWRFPERRMLALTMWLGWVGCVVVDFTLSMPWHPVLFPIADVLVGLAAFSTWWETRSRAPVVILVLALGCVLTNAAYAWAGGKADTYAYKATLNVLFALQCLTLGGWGTAYVVDRTLGFTRRGRAARLATQSDRRSSRTEGGR